MRLKQARNEAGLTLEAAAEGAGLDLTTIWRYEAGQRSPTGLALAGLARTYSKPVEWFFGEEEEPVPPGSTENGQEADLSDQDPLLQEAELALRSMGNDLTPGDIKAIRDFIRFVHTQRQQEENETEPGS